MNDPFDAVPVLPVVIPVGIAVFLVFLWRLHSSKRFSVPRAAVAAALSVYVSGIIANTVFPVYLSPPARLGPWSPGVALTPFVDYELEDAVMNLLVFVLLSRIPWSARLIDGFRWSNPARV